MGVRGGVWVAEISPLSPPPYRDQEIWYGAATQRWVLHPPSERRLTLAKMAPTSPLKTAKIATLCKGCIGGENEVGRPPPQQRCGTRDRWVRTRHPV